jgi:hypothetical protein
MDKVRLLELENKFILLKRYHYPLEEIAPLLPSVSKRTLEKWEKS